MDCCSPGREIIVEVKRLVVDGRTCVRCGDSWDAALRAVREVEGDLAGVGIRVRLVERPLPPDLIDESNTIIIHGRPVEEWLAEEIGVGVSACPSCEDLVGGPVCCRTYEVGGKKTEAPTPDVIARAIRRAAATPGLAPARALRVLIVTTSGCG